MAINIIIYKLEVTIDDVYGKTYRSNQPIFDRFKFGHYVIVGVFLQYVGYKTSSMRRIYTGFDY